MISESKRLIFIHIPKTGGNSIQRALLPVADEEMVCKSAWQDGKQRFELHHPVYGLTKHATLADYQMAIRKRPQDHYRVVTCVRNPWDRMISFFFSPHRGTNAWNKAEFVQLLDKIKPAAAFLTLNTEDTPSANDIHFLRFENLVADAVDLFRDLGMGATQLPHANKSEHRDYRTYYDDELIELVAAKSKFEIEKFKYTFDS
jgi:hypothetical protein